MTEPFTFEFVSALLVTVGAVAAVWFRIEARIRISEAQLETRIAANAAAIKANSKEVSDLRIEVMREYASVKHLDKVESRLINALDRLTGEVKQMREAWAGVPSRTRRTGPK